MSKFYSGAYSRKMWKRKIRKEEKEKNYKRYLREGPNRLKDPRLINQAAEILKFFFPFDSKDHLQRILNNRMEKPPSLRFILKKLPDSMYSHVKRICCKKCPEEIKSLSDIERQCFKIPEDITIFDILFFAGGIKPTKELVEYRPLLMDKYVSVMLRYG